MRGATLSPQLSTARSEAADHDEHRKLVQRILASPVFQKSERLSRLLQYICEEAFEGRAEEINEQRAGEAVFGRPRNYHSTVDGIVRTQASRLRQRLEMYFKGEGSEEPLRLVVPRGSYVPTFEPRVSREPLQTETELPSIPAAVAADPSEQLEQSRTWRWLPWFLVATLACALCIVLVRDRSISQSQRSGISASHPFWSQIFRPGETTLLIPGDSSLVIYEGLRGHNVDLAQYVSGSYRDPDNLPTSTPEQLAAHLANARYTSIVDLEVAQTLALISKSQMATLEVRYPREARPNDLKQGNLILVGAAEANPWVYLFEENMNFVFSNDREHRVFSVLNRKPRPDEPPQWDSGFRQTTSCLRSGRISPQPCGKRKCSHSRGNVDGGHRVRMGFRC